jgi:protein-S-isoprenylcysteine O-methyltransferase Ste14
MGSIQLPPDLTERIVSATADNAGVIARPPLLYAAALVIVLALRWFWPMPMLGRAVALWAGVSLIVLGLAIAIAGRRALQAAATNVDPMRPTTAIVTSGPYRFSRNPLYVALTLLYLGLTLVFNTLWGLVVLIPLVITMHCGVVLREERYLEGKFGDVYRQYRSKVRRYF